MRDVIKFSIIGQPTYWWETLDFEAGLKIHHNPHYVDSMGEASASVSGEICNRTLKMGDCVRTVTAKPATVDNQSFDRYLLDVAA